MRSKSLIFVGRNSPKRLRASLGHLFFRSPEWQLKSIEKSPHSCCHPSSDSFKTSSLNNIILQAKKALSSWRSPHSPHEPHIECFPYTLFLVFLPSSSSSSSSSLLLPDQSAVALAGLRRLLRAVCFANGRTVGALVCQVLVQV